MRNPGRLIGARRSYEDYLHYSCNSVREPRGFRTFRNRRAPFGGELDKNIALESTRDGNSWQRTAAGAIYRAGERDLASDRRQCPAHRSPPSFANARRGCMPVPEPLTENTGEESCRLSKGALGR